MIRYLERVMRSREPDVVIGTYDHPYVFRWYLIPRNPILSIYLHHFVRGDEDDALHDHMSFTLSYIVENGYAEEFRNCVRLRKVGRVYLRDPWSGHKIHLVPYGTEKSPANPLFCTATTIFVTGPRFRNWGFHCPKGWVPWQKIIKTGHYGARPGCAAFDAKSSNQTTKHTV